MSKKWMERVTPESMGIPSRSILAYLQELERSGCCMHGFCILRHGQVIAEGHYKPFTAQQRHRMYSSSKSMTAIAVGLLQDEGKISLEDSICDYFKDRQPEQVHPWIRETTIRDMLRMATCFVTSPYQMVDNPQHDWIRTAYECPPTHRSGHVFSYDTGVATVLAALVEELSGMELMEYLRQRLAPLNLSPESICVKVPDGKSSWGGSGVLCTQRDFAKLALFSLNLGQWEGKQLISREFMEAATSKQIENGKHGYGYQFWMGPHGFSMLGMGGQMAFCIPEADMILVTTADMQADNDKRICVEDRFYELVLAQTADSALPEDREAVERLERYVSGLEVKPIQGAVHSPIETQVSGKRYEMAPNEEGAWSSLRLGEVSLEFQGDQGVFQWDNNRLEFGLGHFVFQDFPGFASAEEAEGVPPVVYWYESERPVLHMPCMTSAAWKNDSVLEILCYAIGDFLGTLKIRCVFEDNGITVQMQKFAEKFWEELQGFQSGFCRN